MNAIQIFGSLGQQQSGRQFCDIFLQAQAEGAAPEAAHGDGVWAHRVLLAAVSPYFFNLFNKDQDYKDSRYTVKGVEPTALRAVVDYLYQPESLVVTADNAQTLLSAASLLAVDGVRDEVYAYLGRALTARAAFEPRACSVLAADTARFVRNHFAPLLELLEPLDDKTTALLDSLTVSVEQHVLDAVLQWTQHVPKGKSAVLRAVLKYIFRPESLSLMAVNTQAQSPAASLLAVEGVRDEVCVSLEHALTVDNALRIHAFAEQHACTALAAAAMRFVHDHYQEVLQTDELLELSADALAVLLDRLTVPIEKHLLDAVLRWTRHRPQERRRHLAELLQRVRLPAVPQEVLAERARAEPLASADLPVKDIVIRALTFHCQPADSRAEDAAASAWYRPRQSRASALLVVGGNTYTGASSDVLYHELSTGRWQSAPDLPAPRHSHGVAELDGCVYVVGGHDGSSPQSTVLVLDVATGSWTTGPTLRTTRCVLGVAALGGVLYAAGGCGSGGGNFRSAEALDPRVGVWWSIADMSTDRQGVAVSALGGLLYAAGGWDGRRRLDTVERYDPAATRWQPAESMGERRAAAGAGVVDDELYVVGGYDGSTLLRSVERYRDGAGWLPAPDMSMTRSWPAVATHAGRLYVAGGSSLSSVAVYEPASSAWSELPAMPAGRSASAAVVVDWSPAAL